MLKQLCHEYFIGDHLKKCEPCHLNLWLPYEQAKTPGKTSAVKYDLSMDKRPNLQYLILLFQSVLDSPVAVLLIAD